MIVYKFSVPLPGDSIIHHLPNDAKVLCVQVQGKVPQMWVLLDKDSRKVPRQFKLVGTGWDFGGGEYVGTFQTGEFVWHLFEMNV